VTGVAEGPARRLNRGFSARMTRGYPWITVKLAASLDGRTAMASGESRWITGPLARADVHRRRGRSGAILTGIETVLADDPALTARRARSVQQPLRVVVDSRLRLPVDARLIREPGRTLVATVAPDPDRAAALGARGVEILKLPSEQARVALQPLLIALGQREINDVLVEAGPTLAGALVQHGLIDELILYVAPHLMGDRGRGLFSLPGLERMIDRVELEIERVNKVGPDLRVIARLA